MPTLYPIQDAFIRGEISPRLHSRASLDLYKAALSKCENFITLPHGGIRKRGGTYFVGEVKDSSRATRLVEFIFSSEQAYALEVGHLYIRVYAYGARVGTVEVATSYVEADIWDLDFVQSADVMWIMHKDYPLQMLTRTAHTTWTIEPFVFEDGPYDALNTEQTTLTPSDTGHLIPAMTTNTAPSGTASTLSGSASAYVAFDRSKAYSVIISASGAGTVGYDTGGPSKTIDAYWITAAPDVQTTYDYFTAWEVQGSNDGATWVTLDSRAGETGWANSETRFYEFSPSGSFRYHQISFTGGGGSDSADTSVAEIAFHVVAAEQTPFDLTASSIAGINDGTGFQPGDIGRAIRLLGSDGVWRWAKITSRTSTLVVKVQLYGHALPDMGPIVRWRLGTFIQGQYVESGCIFEERLAFSRRFSVYASATGDFTNFALGAEDDDALEFLQAGGGQANDIVWLAESDGALLIGTSGGIRALSGSGLDEALTPSSFKNRRSRTFGCAKVRPIDAGQSFIYVTRSRRALAELIQNASGRFTSEDIGQVSEHIPKKGIVQIAYQTDPDPLLWFPVDSGEVGSYTHQPSQEVRGMHRHKLGGATASTAYGIVESCIVTPSQTGGDDVWMIVRRVINGVTKRYIEIKTNPFEDNAVITCREVDSSLSYTGPPATSFSIPHLVGQTVDIFAGSIVYRGRTVNGSGVVSLPGGAPAVTFATVGLPYEAAADTLELDVGGRDGSRMGRRKRVSKVILSVLETDLSGLEISSLQRGSWEPVRIPTTAAATTTISLYTGNVEVPIDDSWEGQGRVRIRHVNPTPCTIRAIMPVFDGEP